MRTCLPSVGWCWTAGISTYPRTVNGTSICKMSDVSTENAEHYAQAMGQMFYVDRVLMSLKDTVDTVPA